MSLITGQRLPTLSSSRLDLRWLEEADAPALFDVFSDAEVMRYWSSPPWTDPAQAAAFIRGIHASFRSGSLYQWGVARREDGAVVGTCTLAGVDERNRRAEIGFILRRDCWGQGLMREAVGRLIDFAFTDLRLHRIEADADPRNDACLRLLARLGFQREGLLRERWLVGDEINDTVFYGLLAREWMARGAD